MRRPSVYLFAGDNEYSKEKAIIDLKSSLLKECSGSDLDYKVFRGGEVNFREILDCITTIPFLSAQRLVVIRNIEDFNDEDLERLIAYIKKPLSSACLVLDAGNESVINEHGELAKFSKIERFDDMTDAELRSWAKKFVGSRTGLKKNIEDDAVSQLKELHGKNLMLISRELEKLIAFTGERGVITLEDVEAVSARSAFASAFDLTRAIEKNDPDKALSIVSDLAITGKKHHEIVGLLCWHLRRILRAKTLQAKGRPDSHVANALRIGWRYRDDFFKQVKVIGITESRAKLKLLLEADLDIKRSRLDPTLILEFVVIKLCLGWR